MVRGVNSSDVYFASFWGVIAAAQAAGAAHTRRGRRPFLCAAAATVVDAAALQRAQRLLWSLLG